MVWNEKRITFRREKTLICSVLASFCQQRRGMDGVDREVRASEIARK